MQESAQSQATIPLFPLGVVLMPHIHLPLHIFEERYKLMIKECLAQNTEFGIVYFNGKKLMSAGCTAKIIEVLKYYDDGRCDIITCGEKRFTISEIYDRSAYLQAQVAFFDDQDEANPEICRQLAQQGLDLLKQFGDISGQQDEIRSSDPGDIESSGDIKSLSFKIAGCDGFDLLEKQKFLEMTSTYERLRKSTQSLGKILERIKLNSAISKIINGNGNLSGYSSESAE
jgi:Lon protease-like protein